MQTFSSLLMFSVCEKQFHETTVENMVPVCETVEEQVCNEDTGICKTFPKQACRIENTTSTQYIPEVKCKKIQTDVCGPEPCPVVKMEPVCYDEVKKVTIINSIGKGHQLSHFHRGWCTSIVPGS